MARGWRGEGWRRGVAIALLVAACRGDDARSDAGGGTAVALPRHERRRDLLIERSFDVVHAPSIAAPELVGDWERVSADDRLELVVTAGSEVHWPRVTLHPRARLAYRIGVSKLDREGLKCPLRCTIAFERDGLPREELLTISCAAGAPADTAGTLDLAARAGETGTLVIVTAAQEPGGARIAWRELRLESEGRPESDSDRVQSCERVVADLAELHGPASRAAGAIVLPVPGHATVRVTVPPLAHLRFFESVAVSVGSHEKGAITLRVRVDDAVLRERRLRPETAAMRPLRDEVELDLSAFADREVAIQFEAEPVRAAATANAFTASFLLPRLVAPKTVARQPRGSGPDVIYIVVDTLRADVLGTYGYARPTSPALDAFARDALVLETAYSPSPWTLPSTASLLTGLHPDVHGATLTPWLFDQLETIGERFAAAGVTTGAFVANTLVSRRANFQQGFETWVDGAWGNANKIVPRVLDWLDDHEGDRLFAYLHFIDPHTPYAAPLPPELCFPTDPANPFCTATGPEIAERFTGATGLEHVVHGIPQAALPAIARMRDLYDDEVRYFDQWFAVLMDGLRARGRLAGSVIVVTADHGEEFLEHDGLFHRDHLYGEAVHVPLIVRAPGLAAGRVATPFTTIDLAPLILDLAGLGGAAPPHELEPARFAESILLTTELATEPESDEPLRREAIVRGGLKLIVTPERDRIELYDLRDDPGEHHDLAEREPRMRDALQSLLRQRRDDYARQAPMAAISGLPDRSDELRALGYIK